MQLAVAAAAVDRDLPGLRDLGHEVPARRALIHLRHGLIALELVDQLLPLGDIARRDALEVVDQLDLTLHQQIVERLLNGLEPEILDEYLPVYRCGCSRERTEEMLRSLGKKELDDIIREDHGAEVCCHFCEKKYTFTEEELAAIRDSIQPA